MAAKAPQLIQQYVTGGDRSLRDWHLLLRRVTFGAALVLMGGSVVSLHWACNLIGLSGYWEPVAWLVPLAMETGMAAVASTATTIRKPPKPGSGDEVGGYYFSLWFIFSFVMLLAQASNIGHAMTKVADAADQLPPVIPVTALYVFAGAFAALFPMGGTLFIHVSGFLRAHGTGARWIEEDAEIVHVQVAPGTVTAPKARAPRGAHTVATDPGPARATDAQPPRAPRPAERAQPARSNTDAQTRMRALFDQQVSANPVQKPDAAAMQRELGIDVHPATARRWVAGWWADHEETMGMNRPDPVPTPPPATDHDTDSAVA